MTRVLILLVKAQLTLNPCRLALMRLINARLRNRIAPSVVDNVPNRPSDCNS